MLQCVLYVTLHIKLYELSGKITSNLDGKTKWENHFQFGWENQMGKPLPIWMGKPSGKTTSNLDGKKKLENHFQFGWENRTYLKIWMGKPLPNFQIPNLYVKTLMGKPNVKTQWDRKFEPDFHYNSLKRFIIVSNKMSITRYSAFSIITTFWSHYYRSSWIAKYWSKLWSIVKYYWDNRIFSFRFGVKLIKKWKRYGYLFKLHIVYTFLIHSLIIRQLWGLTAFVKLCSLSYNSIIMIIY